MTLADLIHHSTNVITEAYELFQSQEYNRVIEMLGPIIAEIRPHQQERPNTFILNLNIGLALEHSSNAKSMAGNLDDAVQGWYQAISMYDSALAVPLEEINRQFLDLGLFKYSIKDEEALSRVRVQMQIGKAGSLLRLANALKERKQEEARLCWDAAKSTYDEVVNNHLTPPEVLTGAAITYAKMCLTDGELDRAGSLYRLAMSQPTINPWEIAQIYAGLQSIELAQRKN